MFGLDVDTQRNIRKTIAQFPHIEKVLIYGSRAKGNYKAGSDIDITLIAEDLTLKNSVYPLSTALDELHLPYTFDISILNQLENPDFVDHILRVGKTFYQKEKAQMDGWKTTPFVKCIRHIATPKKIPRKQFKDAGRFPIVSQERNFINGYWSNEADVIHVESPLIVFGDHTQILKYIDFDFVVGADGVKLIQPEVFLNPKYFYYFLMGNPVSSLGYSRHYRLLKDLDVVFPESLCEQKRIVAILDEAFAAIAAATANTEKNIANAQELFDSELNRVFQPPQSAEDSVSDVTVDWHLLGDLINIQSGYAFNSKKYTDVGHFLVRIGNVQDGYLSLDRPKYVSLDSKTQRFSLNEGDFLTSLTGNIGRVARMDKLHLPAALNQRVARLTVNDVSMLLEDYLYYFLTSSLFRTALSTSGRGAAQQNVSPATINEIAIPLPSLPEQKRIARFLDKLSAEKQTLVETYKTKIHSLAELKQSLLHQAFTGELTADKNTTKRTLANTRI